MLNCKIEDLRAMLRAHEGDRLDVYADTQGIWTTGNGFNMERSDARTVCKACGIDYDAAMALKGTRRPAITNTQREALLDHCIAEVIPQVRKIVSSFDSLSGSRQLALLDIAWAGIGTLREFRDMLAAVSRGDWKTAAAELLDSQLARQWGQRAIRDAELLCRG